MMGIKEKFEEMVRLLVEKGKMKMALENVDRQISELRNELKTEIPEGATVDGISHIVHEHRNVSYANALKVIVREVIPPSKQSKAWAILERMTDRVKNHSFVSYPPSAD